MNAVLYARFSPRPNAEECDSIEKQIERLTEFCQRQSWYVNSDRVFFDRGESGAKRNRDGLYDAIYCTQQLKKTGVLVVWDWSRLARDTLFILQVFEDLSRRKATLWSVTEGAFATDDPNVKLLTTIKSAINEHHRDMVRARTRAAMLRYQKAGRRMSKLTPYGWTKDPVNQALLVPDLDEQDVIKWIESEYAAGRKLRAIGRELEKEGILCRGGKWQHTTIRSILRRSGKLRVEAISPPAGWR